MPEAISSKCSLGESTVSQKSVITTLNKLILIKYPNHQAKKKNINKKTNLEMKCTTTANDNEHKSKSGSFLLAIPNNKSKSKTANLEIKYNLAQLKKTVLYIFLVLIKTETFHCMRFLVIASPRWRGTAVLFQ